MKEAADNRSLFPVSAILRNGSQPNLLHAVNVITIAKVRNICGHNVALTVSAEKLAANENTRRLMFIAHDAAVHRLLFHSVSPT
jgi:hypothetical protein